MKKALIFFLAVLVVLGAFYFVNHPPAHRTIVIPPTLQMPTKVVDPVSQPQPCTENLKDYPFACDAS